MIFLNNEPAGKILGNKFSHFIEGFSFISGAIGNVFDEISFGTRAGNMLEANIKFDKEKVKNITPEFSKRLGTLLMMFLNDDKENFKLALGSGGIKDGQCFITMVLGKNPEAPKEKEKKVAPKTTKKATKTVKKTGTKTKTKKKGA